ncbi:monooxygenase [Recurvomyces mirabilis]|nr:monooxygenase [Recurvomyces mirabilis]
MVYHLPNNGRWVAVIGAGAAGLAAAKYLLGEGLLVPISERKAQPGGVWNTTRMDDCTSSPVYDGLETNLPRSLMTFSDVPWLKDTSLFPRSSEVFEYLKTYASKLEQSPLGQSNLLVKCNTTVKEVKHGTSMGRQCWRIRATQPLSPRDVQSTDCFDAVVITIGNYHHPFVPPLEGISEPCTQQLSAETHVGVTGVQQFNHAVKTVTFENGTELAVDKVIICTGYSYDFSFIRQAGDDLISPVGVSVRNVYKHLLYTENPTLTFVGLPTMSATFTVAEAQSAVVARIFSSRLSLPSRPELRRWYDESTQAHEDLVRSGGADPRHYHSFRLRDDKQYVNEVLEWSLRTAENLTIHRDQGMPPPFWCGCLDRARETSREMRKEFLKLGGARHLVTNHQALGSEHDGPCSQGRNMKRRLKGRCRACYLYK